MVLNHSYQKDENQKCYWYIEVVNFTIKHLNIHLKNINRIISTYSDFKAVFVERFNRTLLHIINKLIFINGVVNWVDILNDAKNHNNKIHSTIILTPVVASNNPDKVRYVISISTKTKPNLKSVIISGMLTNVTFSLKNILLTGIEKYLDLMKF